MKKIKYKINFKDSRGYISDLVQNENINAVTLINFKKNSIRGNHYHKKTWQWNLILKGNIKLVTQKGNSKKNNYNLSKGNLFLLAPNEKHALKALSSCDLLVLTKGPRGGKEYEIDTFRLKKNLI
jgi:quercetin dioxygenase-like cupin family protein